jgi:hypothetical protein
MKRFTAWMSKSLEVISGLCRNLPALRIASCSSLVPGGMKCRFFSFWTLSQ